MYNLEIEILKIIKEYATRDKPADRNFIYRVLEVIIRIRKLNDWINLNNTIIKYDDSSLTFYSPEKKMVQINLLELEEEAQVNWEYFLSNDPFKEVFSLYFTIIEVLLHECDHAFQNILISSDKQDPLTRVLRASYSLDAAFDFTIEEFLDMPLETALEQEGKDLKMILFNEVYDEFHNFAPEERLADISAYRFLHNIIKLLSRANGKDFGNFLFKCKFFWIDSLLEPYRNFDIGSCPTEYFFALMKNDSFKSLSSLNSTLSLKDRFYLGLRLSGDELKKINNIKDSNEKRISFTKK